jgi:hypothetical protein
VHFFITFMVISRCMKTLKRVFEDLQVDKQSSRKHLIRERSRSTVFRTNNDELVRDILESASQLARRDKIIVSSPINRPIEDE